LRGHVAETGGHDEPKYPLADAILDRIVHSAHKIALKGESLRKAKAKKSESA
jgi:DNA replication protein DnaC